MLENAIKKYNNGLLTTAEIIQFLVDEVAKRLGSTTKEKRS